MKQKNNIIFLFFIGFLIGIGKILPIISGTLIAVYFGIYDYFLNIISDFPKSIFKEYRRVVPIILGILIAIPICSKLLLFVYVKYTFYYSIFIVLFLIYQIIKLLLKTKILCRDILVIAVLSLVQILLCALDIEVNVSFKTYFLIGIIEAISTIIPGVSGTVIFLNLNIYNEVLKLYNNYLSLHFLIFFTSFLLSLYYLSKILLKILKIYNDDELSLVFTIFSFISIIVNILIV